MVRKKALSPIISTILLVMIVIVIAIIILLWSQGFIKEAILKEIAGESKRVEAYCSEVVMKSVVQDDGTFGVSNAGTIPIYRLNVKLVGLDSGNSEIVKIEGSEGILNPGNIKIIENPSIGSYDSYQEIKIIPVLLGKSKSGEVKEFECPEENGVIV